MWELSERDAFEHGALLSCWPTFEILSAHPGSTLAEITTASPKSKPTVLGHLRQLEGFGLLASDDGAWTADASNISAKLRRAGEESGTAGRGARRAERIRRERETARTMEGSSHE
jgi:hypothetical protein